MRFAFLILIALALGCATATYNPETGESTVRAFGKSTASANAEGASVTGGPLSDGIVGVFQPLAEALRGFFGGTPANVIVNMPDTVTMIPAPSPEP